MSTKKKSYKEIEQAFKDRGYELLSKEYVNAFGLLEYICPLHPNKIQKINWNKFQQGKGCKECGYERVSSILKIKKRKPYNELLRMFEKEKLVLLTSEKEYFEEENPILSFLCKKHGKQNKSYIAFKYAPYCSKCKKEQKQKEVQEKGYKEFLRLCKSIGYEPASPIEKYKNVLSPMKCKCPKHGIYITNVSHLQEGKRCPACKETRGERKIREWLEKNEIEFESQKRFKDLRTKNGAPSYDFYIPSNNLLIEYQGEFHDGTAEMYKGSYKEQKIRDKKKKDYALKNNYKLLEIWYWDFDRIENILKKEMKR